jgi:hypothetical protein
MPPKRYYAVRHINQRVAVLLDDDKQQIAVPLNRLPAGIEKGDLLGVPTDQSGTPSWSDASIDHAERERRSETVVDKPQESNREDSSEPADIK